MSFLRKINPWMAITFILVGVIVGFGASKLPYFQSNVLQDKKVEAPKELSKDKLESIALNSPFKGDENAPVTIVEFAAFECGACAAFTKNILPALENEYINSGKVKFVYRTFPLGGQAGIKAALASKCANEQNKFWEMYETIFEDSSEWGLAEDPNEVFVEYAEQLGFDKAQFSECVTSAKYSDEVEKDYMEGAGSGVNATPSFFINGKMMTGALPFEKFLKPIIEAELAGKKWKVIYELYQGEWYPSAIKVNKWWLF